MSSHKGDWHRIGNFQSFQSNYEDIFKKKPMKPEKRQDLALMMGENEIVIELGVAAGKFAEQLLTTNPKIKYIGIDRWSDHHDDAEMHGAVDRVSRFKGNAVMMRHTFVDALPLFEDDFADMIYIDGYAHTGQEGGQTLEDWWPKLKHSGIFAGHDYDKNYPQTIQAVDNFVNKLRSEGVELELNIINEKPNCSWWFKKI